MSRYSERARNVISAADILLHALTIRANRNPGNGPAVSLTTYPKRLGTVRYVLRTLARQTLAPEAIYLVLARDEIPVLPDRLARDVELLGVNVVWVEGNIRSYKKLLPVYDRLSARHVVTADDDVLYPPWWLEELARGAKRWPGRVIGTRATWMKDGPGGFLPYKTWDRARLCSPHRRVFLTGRGGILYPPGSLHPDVMDIAKAVELAPEGDDLWFKTMSLRAGVECVAVGDGREFPGLGSQKEALHRGNVTAGVRNDYALALLDAEYGLRSLL